MKTALVLGGAGCVWRDLDAALALGEFDAAFGCNDIGVVYPGVLDGWVSLHPEMFGGWVQRRQALSLPPHKAILGHIEAPTGNPRLPACVDRYVPHRFPGQVSGGSSGLFALKLALDEYDRAVLCGIPLNVGQGHFFNPAAWTAAGEYRQAWREALPAIRGRARSMSGWTRDLLGPPTEEWLAR